MWTVRLTSRWPNIIVNARHKDRVLQCRRNFIGFEDRAEDFLPMAKGVDRKKVQLRCCEKSYEMLKEIFGCSSHGRGLGDRILDYILAVKIVKDVDEAIEHINRYGTMHSGIVTESYTNATSFKGSRCGGCLRECIDLPTEVNSGSGGNRNQHPKAPCKRSYGACGIDNYKVYNIWKRSGKIIQGIENKTA